MPETLVLSEVGFLYLKLSFCVFSIRDAHNLFLHCVREPLCTRG